MEEQRFAGDQGFAIAKRLIDIPITPLPIPLTTPPDTTIYFVIVPSGDGRVGFLATLIVGVAEQEILTKVSPMRLAQRSARDMIKDLFSANAQGAQ